MPTKLAGPIPRKPFSIARSGATVRPAAVRSSKVESAARAVVDAETVLSRGRMWRMASGYAVAYVTNPDVACEIIGSSRRSLDQHAMAYYTDRKGKTYAWQVSFRSERWDEVARRLA